MKPFKQSQTYRIEGFKRALNLASVSDKLIRRISDDLLVIGSQGKVFLSTGLVKNKHRSSHIASGGNLKRRRILSI